MKKITVCVPLSLATALLLPAAASADMLGLKIGASIWEQNYEGTVQSGPDSLDLEKQLGLSDETNNSFFIALEHPVPIIPNIMLARTELKVDEDTVVDEFFVFDGVPFLKDTELNTDADLSHTDLTLYYEVLDNWVSLDLGLTVRKFDEGIELSYTGPILGNKISASEEFDDAIPMLYVAAKFDLPLTGLYVGGDLNAMKYDGDQIIDYKVNLGYEASFGLGVELGFRSMEFDYEDTRTEKADVTVDGGYASLYYHF